MVHQLLLHLEKKGFAGSPRFLGLDEQGREILTFLEGETSISAHAAYRSRANNG
jgi:hypothetical protein